MTLVVSLLSPNHAIQVSDRKLVWLDGDGSVRERPGEFNKAVLYCKVMAFAYCGLAEMGPRRQRTDLWIADTLRDLGDRDQGELLEALAVRSTDRLAEPVFTRNLSAAQRRHAFAAVGWANIGGGTEMEPYLAVVSNFHGIRNGVGVELPEAQPKFKLAAQHRLSGDETFAFWVGPPQRIASGRRSSMSSGGLTPRRLTTRIAQSLH